MINNNNNNNCNNCKLKYQQEWNTILNSRGRSGIPSLEQLSYTVCACSNCKMATKKHKQAVSALSSVNNNNNNSSNNNSNNNNSNKSTAFKQLANPERNLRLGDRVAVKNKTGVIRYIGVLDSKYDDGQVFVGIKLDDPVGDHDGVVKGKRYFTCPDKHGVMVPAGQVVLLLPREIKQRTQDGLNILAKSNKYAKASGTQTSPDNMDSRKKALLSASTIPPKPSLTGRLLGDLPVSSFYQAPSSDKELQQLTEISDWATAWGGDHNAWAMANTLDKLKKANRKGAQERDWQWILYALEEQMPEEFRPHLEQIQAMREEISKLQAERERHDLQIKLALEQSCSSDLTQELIQLQQKVDEERSKCISLQEDIAEERNIRTQLRENGQKLSERELRELEAALAVTVSS